MAVQRRAEAVLAGAARDNRVGAKVDWQQVQVKLQLGHVKFVAGHWGATGDQVHHLNMRHGHNSRNRNVLYSNHYTKDSVSYPIMLALYDRKDKVVAG